MAAPKFAVTAGTPDSTFTDRYGDSVVRKGSKPWEVTLAEAQVIVLHEEQLRAFLRGDRPTGPTYDYTPDYGGCLKLARKASDSKALRGSEWITFGQTKASVLLSKMAALRAWIAEQTSKAAA